MEKTIEEMIRAVADALEHDVLTSLEAQSLPAGNVRACLMLLTYIEDRVKLESSALLKSNKILAEALQTISMATETPDDKELINRIKKS